MDPMGMKLFTSMLHECESGFRQAHNNVKKHVFFRRFESHHLSHEKQQKLLHSVLRLHGRLIGNLILVMVYYNPDITG